mgnify:CR=1 FL=1
MEESYCAQCIHYVPHYIKFGENLFDLIRCGHCTYPRRKHRDAYAKVCANFQPLPEACAEKEQYQVNTLQTANTRERIR